MRLDIFFALIIWRILIRIWLHQQIIIKNLKSISLCIPSEIIDNAHVVLLLDSVIQLIQQHSLLQRQCHVRHVRLLFLAIRLLVLFQSCARSINSQLLYSFLITRAKLNNILNNPYLHVFLDLLFENCLFPCQIVILRVFGGRNISNGLLAREASECRVLSLARSTTTSMLLCRVWRCIIYYYLLLRSAVGICRHKVRGLVVQPMDL